MFPPKLTVQQYQPANTNNTNQGGGGMIPIPEKWFVYDWYTTLKNTVISNICLANRIWRSNRYIQYIAHNIEYRGP